MPLSLAEREPRVLVRENAPFVTPPVREYVLCIGKKSVYGLTKIYSTLWKRWPRTAAKSFVFYKLFLAYFRRLFFLASMSVSVSGITPSVLGIIGSFMASIALKIIADNAFRSSVMRINLSDLSISQPKLIVS